MRDNWLNVAELPGVSGREDRQYGWQKLFGALLQNRTILDVGAGLGLSRSRLQGNNNTVTLQDIGPGLPVDIKHDITEIDSKSFDIVTAFDVIEHVKDDNNFLKELTRIARGQVIITTPNLLISQCRNPFHCREYSPSDLIKLVYPHRICLLMTGKNMVHTMLSQDRFLLHTEPSQAIVIES